MRSAAHTARLRPRGAAGRLTRRPTRHNLLFLPSNSLQPSNQFPEARMKHPVSLSVNGVTQTAEVEPRLLLVHFLRDTLGLTGTNVGCDTSQCGSCTVMIDGQAVKSCTVLAVQADGSRVMTI